MAGHCLRENKRLEYNTMIFLLNLAKISNDMKTTILATILMFSLTVLGQSYEAETSNYEMAFNFPFHKNKSVYLAYYLQGKTYVKDTILLDSYGKHSKSYTLSKGQYIISFVDADQNFSFFVDSDSSFSIFMENANQLSTLKFTNSIQNSNYIQFQNDIQKLLQKRNDVEKSIEKDDVKSKRYVEIFQKALSLYQKFIDNNPNTIAAQSVAYEYAIMTVPAEDRISHYASALNVFEQSSYYTSNFYQLLNKIIDDPNAPISEKLMYLGAILDESTQFEFGYRNLLIYLLNYTAKSKQIYAEDIYYWLAQHYNYKENTNWIDDVQRKKILDNAAQIKPTLIGTKVPDFQLERNKVKTNFNTLRQNIAFVVVFFNANALFTQNEINIIISACEKIQQKKSNTKVLLVYVQNVAGEKLPDMYNNLDLLKCNNLLMTSTVNNVQLTKDYRLKGGIRTYKLDTEGQIELKRFGVEQIEKFI
jgi:tetratricopeptide (TPR) repeat protein